MYNSIDNSTGSSLQFTGGINKNVQIKEIGFGPVDKEGKGQHVLYIMFSDASGRSLRHVEWPINEQTLTQNARSWGRDPKELIKTQYADQAARMKHILSAYIPADQIQMSGSNYKEFCINWAQLFPQGYKEQLNHLLLVYPKTKKWPELPKKTFDPFFEKMDGETSLKINPEFHRIEPPIDMDSANGAPVPATAGAYDPMASSVPTPQATAPVVEQGGLNMAAPAGEVGASVPAEPVAPVTPSIPKEDQDNTRLLGGNPQGGHQSGLSF